MQSTTEGAIEERGEEMVGLTQRFALHRTQAFHPLDDFQKSLLMGDVWNRNAHLANLVEVFSCSTVLIAYIPLGVRP